MVRRPNARRLIVRVEHDAASDLAARLQARIGVPVDIERVPAGSLSRAAFKPERVVDEPAGPDELAKRLDSKADDDRPLRVTVR